MDKSFILEEIRRTTSANGGTPLGHRTFFKETGIKEADWKGKIWARWGDAIREAGFEPNVLTQAYDESFLLSKYADLALELKHLPVTAELRLKSRNDPEFPNSDTFEGRWGNKAGLVSRLTTFCESRPEYADVLAYCQKYSSRNKKSDESTNLTKSEIGYVYLLKSGKFYKIGRTNSVERRSREITIQLPENLKTVHILQTDDPSGIENYWHQRFADKRKNGEWFELSAADVAAFRRRKFM